MPLHPSLLLFPLCSNGRFSRNSISGGTLEFSLPEPSVYACDIAVFTIWCQLARQHFTGIEISQDMFVSHCNLGNHSILAYTHVHVHVLKRDEKKGRTKQAKSNKQQGKATQYHPRQSLFLRKMSCLGWYTWSFTVIYRKWLINKSCRIVLFSLLKLNIISSN